MADTYQLVTEEITAALEAVTVPWQKPWAVGGGIARNLVSKRAYRGMNLVLLALGTPYASPWWLTYRQSETLGGHVKKGEKASLVTFWKLPERSHAGSAGRGRRRGPAPRAPPAPLLRVQRGAVYGDRRTAAAGLHPYGA